MFFFLTWCGNAEANKCTFPIENILRLLCMHLKLEKVFFFIKRLQFAFANKSWAEYLKTDGNKWQRRLKIKFIFFRKSVQLEICSNRKKFQPLLHMCKQWQRTRPQNTDRLCLVYTQSWFPFSATRLLRLLFVICCHFIVATISLWCAYIYNL